MISLYLLMLDIVNRSVLDLYLFYGKKRNFDLSDLFIFNVDNSKKQTLLIFFQKND
jgi:hypothetical protein